MIHSLSANKASFHKITFKSGLNIILAERSTTSTEKDTRNGIGKSTLIEIIDFCLGSRATKGQGLLIEPLVDWSFTLEITIKENRVKITRSINDQNIINIKGSTKGWPEQPELNEKTGELYFKADRWRAFLGLVLFNTPQRTSQSAYKPSYRSLISYFIRRGPDAYTSPFRHFRQQKTWDIQLHTAYILGMNWEYASRWQGLKDKEDVVKAFEKAVKTGAMEGAIGTIGELETQSIQLAQKIKDADTALDSFKVHPQYESIQDETTRLTAEIHQHTNSNISDKRKLSHYQKTITEEENSLASSLESLYEEFKITLPENITKTLAEARNFQKKILKNRRGFLESEINNIARSITSRNEEINSLIEQRSIYLETLKTHGALQELTRLQEHNLTLKGQLDRTQARLQELKDIKITKRQVKDDKTDLIRTAETDHEERRDVWSKAVQLFNENSQALYKTPGNLIIDVVEAGYKFQVDIERSGSEGIEKMKIFCFDLAALELQNQLGRGINFLIHDTLMYDSVDARQRALAFERADLVTKQINAQYICTINSDMLPLNDFSENFNFKDHIILTLSDATPEDSLLGIRFERPKRQ